VFWINISTFSSWFFLILPLKFLEPSLASSITLGVGPIIIIIFYRMTTNKNVRRIDYFISCGLFTVFFYLAYLVLFHVDSSGKIIFSKGHLLPIIFCLLSGIGAAFNKLFGRKMAIENFSSLDTLSVRFILLIIGSAILIVLGGLSFKITLMQFIDIFVLSIIMVVIPLYCIQASIRKLEIITIGIIVPLMPVTMFFMEFFDNLQTPSWYTMLGATLIMLLCCMGAISRYHYERG